MKYGQHNRKGEIYMKSKTLVSIAVAGALGASTAAYAGSGHGKWISAGEEQYPAMVFGTETPRGIAGLEMVMYEVTYVEPVGGTFSSSESSLSGSSSSEDSL